MKLGEKEKPFKTYTTVILIMNILAIFYSVTEIVLEFVTNIEFDPLFQVHFILAGVLISGFLYSDFTMKSELRLGDVEITEKDVSKFNRYNFNTQLIYFVGVNIFLSTVAYIYFLLTEIDNMIIHTQIPILIYYFIIFGYPALGLILILIGIYKLASESNIKI